MTDLWTVGEGLGPRPARPHHDPMTQMSAARAGVFAALCDVSGPVTVQQLAASLGQHANTVREHLEVIVAAGLAARSRSTAGRRGRPAVLYRALPPEISRPQIREYAALASVLAGQLARCTPDPQAAAVAAGRAWGETLGRCGPTGRAVAHARTLEVLTHLGFDPTPQHDGSIELRECPLLEAAKQHPGIVCAVHLGLLRSLYDVQGAPSEQVDLEPFARPGACLVHLSQADGQATASLHS